MTMQTKTTAKAARLMLFFFLLSAGAWVSAGSAVVVKEESLTDSVALNVDAPAGVSHEDSSAGRALGSTALLLETVRQNGKQQAAQAAFALGIAAMQRKDLAASQALIREAIQLQPSNPGYLQAAAGLAFLKEEFAEAQAYQVQSLELARAALGPDDIRVATLMDDLGTVYLARHGYTEAERIWRESLAIREQALGKVHPSIAPRLNDLAGVAVHGGRFDEAEHLLKRAIKILEADPETAHMDIAIARHNLADFYVDQQRPAEADALYRKALADWKAVPAPQRLQIAASLNELGNEYLAERRLAGARSQFELVIGLLEDDFGRDHQYVRSARTALDTLQSEQEKLGEHKEFDQRLYEELRSQFSRRSKTL